MRAPVSVIIPCYCNASTIARAVDSVVAQTLPPEEILLVDDCSNDGGATLDALHRLPQTFPQANLRIIALEKNVGPGGARNAAWEQAVQPYIAFLDADDAWHPEKIQVQYTWLTAHADYDLSAHRSIFFADRQKSCSLEDGTELCTTHLRLQSMLFRNSMQTRTVMLRRTLPYRFNECLRFSEDYALWLEIIANGHKAALLNLHLAFCFRPEFSPGGQSANLWKMERSELGIYFYLYSTHKIGFLNMMATTVVSLIKYVRRCLVHWSSPKWLTLSR